MEDGVYEVRYGVTARNVALFAVSLLFAAVSLAPGSPLVMKLLGGGLFGAGTVVFLMFMVVRKVAFRVDERGVTVSGGLLRYRATLLSVPWEDVAALVLWRQHTAANLRYVGVQRRSGGEARGRMVYRGLVPHVPPEVAHSSRPVNGWKLDRERLAAAVGRFAPDVNIVDLG